MIPVTSVAERSREEQRETSKRREAGNEAFSLQGNVRPYLLSLAFSPPPSPVDLCVSILASVSMGFHSIRVLGLEDLVSASQTTIK